MMVAKVNSDLIINMLCYETLIMRREKECISLICNSIQELSGSIESYTIWLQKKEECERDDQELGMI